MIRKHIVFISLVIIAQITYSVVNGVFFAYDTQINNSRDEIIFVSEFGVLSVSEEELEIQKPDTSGNEIYFYAEKLPKLKYLSGIKSFFEENITYPEPAIKNRVEGVVWINFIVEKNGSVSNPKILNQVGFGCEEEVLRVMDNLPGFYPGMIEGEPVRVSVSLPVRFMFKNL